MKIDNYGTGERCREAMRLLLREAEGGLGEGPSRIVLLPIPSTRDGKNISGTERSLEEVLLEVGQGEVVAGYGIPEGLSCGLAERGAAVYDGAGDEDFLTENAELTALGTVGYILTTERRAPCELRFGVVGYGRIGRLLVRHLLFLGGRVKIFTSRSGLRRELGRYAVSTAPIEEALELSEVDILINTAPTDLSHSFPTGRLPRGLRVLELASGKNFQGVEGVELLPSLPGRMYPISAGRAYFRGIMRRIREGII